MDANKQADHVLDRAIDLARHLRRGETSNALQSLTALRGTCDWLGTELSARLITPQVSGDISEGTDAELSEVTHG